ncbi:MAG: hypothetical protein Q8865_10905 [Bacillota bacterium]|nr:hypothetical protein [Bacillota bacterium]
MKVLKILGILFFVSFVFVAVKGVTSGVAPGSAETEPQKIARSLVKQEMQKQVGLKKWKITSNKVASDKDNVNNPGDYDKPMGEKRIVWIEGNVNATSKDGVTGNAGYDLELYQMKGDTKWYIGNHTGVLIDLKVTDKPEVKEENISDGQVEDIMPGKPADATPKDAKSPETTAQAPTALSSSDLKGAWHWKDSDDFYMILRDDNTYSYVEKNAGFYDEGTYTISNTDDGFRVTVQYTTGQNDSFMNIKLTDKNHLEGNEKNNSWKAERISPAAAEDVLQSLKGK